MDWLYTASCLVSAHISSGALYHVVTTCRVGCRVGVDAAGSAAGDASSMMVMRMTRLVMWIMIGPFANALAHALVHCHGPAPLAHHTLPARHPGTTGGSRQCANGLLVRSYLYTQGW